MKIVLKDADFSQSGIPVPYEVVFDGSKYLNAFTGNLESNSNTARGADNNKIPMFDNKVNNESSFVIMLTVLFYDENNVYLGCISWDGGAGYVIVASGDYIRIDSAAHYMKPSGGSLVEMTAQEIAALKVNATYWKIAAQAGSGTISDVSIVLEIVD